MTKYSNVRFEICADARTAQFEYSMVVLKKFNRVIELKTLHNKQMNCPNCEFETQKIKATAVLPLFKNCLPQKMISLIKPYWV
ncbi:hypothetical protein CEN40_16895 [Fischerella thermalis CCMEE 5205]|nr:hypothetical protein CEN40_16895 [Fischerella thermalis CCMEE 5205]